MAIEARVTLMDVKRGRILFDVVKAVTVDAGTIDERVVETNVGSGKLEVPDGMTIPVPSPVQNAVNKAARRDLLERRSTAEDRQTADALVVTDINSGITYLDGVIT